jgi:hypothetical protein
MFFGSVNVGQSRHANTYLNSVDAGKTNIRFFENLFERHLND